VSLRDFEIIKEELWRYIFPIFMPEGVRKQNAEENIGPKRDEMIGGRRKLHNEELHNLYSSQNIIRMIKPRRMRWRSLEHTWVEEECM
jgi:hypothetical protein